MCRKTEIQPIGPRIIHSGILLFLLQRRTGQGQQVRKKLRYHDRKCVNKPTTHSKITFYVPRSIT